MPRRKTVIRFSYLPSTFFSLEVRQAPLHLGHGTFSTIVLDRHGHTICPPPQLLVPGLK